MIGLKWEWTEYVFWVFFAVIAAYLGSSIEIPPIDAHSWRQTYTLGVTRGYFEYGAHLFYPQTILLDSGDGIISQEFPLLNWILAVLWNIFGEETWVYRSFLSLTFLTGIYHLYHFLKKEIGEPAGIFGICLLGSSLFLTYASKAMPDVFGISLVFISLNLALKFLNKGRKRHLILFSLFLGLGVLCKLPSSIPSLLLLIPVARYGIQEPRVKKLIIAGVLSVVSVIIWYFIWVPYLDANYRYKLYYATSLSQGWEEVKANFDIVIDKFSYNLFRNSLSIWIGLIGLVLAIIQRKIILLLVVVMSFILGLFFMLKTGIIFCKHEYYYLPFAPVIAVLGGLGMTEFWKKAKVASLVTLSMMVYFSIHNQDNDLWYWAEHEKYLRLESIVDQYVPKDSRILTNDEMVSPRMMYFAHRRGWNDQRYEDVEWIKNEYTVGMEYLVFRKDRLNIRHPFPILFEDNDFVIYKVEI